jgi:hypothetical protein
MFCKCGKLMTETDFGYECVCGLKKDRKGNEISDDDACRASSEAERIAEIKKKYHSKYPNMDDPVIRVTLPISEDCTTDETFSSLRPSQRKYRNNN